MGFSYGSYANHIFWEGEWRGGEGGGGVDTRDFHIALRQIIFTPSTGNIIWQANFEMTIY